MMIMENKELPIGSRLLKLLKEQTIVIAVVVGIVLIALFSQGDGPTPLEQLRLSYKKTPTYSVVLVDAKEEGNFFKDYYQKLKIIVPGSGSAEAQIKYTDWWKTNDADFENLLPFLGMTVFAKKDGKETDEANPPGYEYVGDKQYGEWRQSSGGGSFWYWYLNYRFWGSMFGTGTITRGDYDAYRSNRTGGRPYFGPNKEYGTQGSSTKQKYPSFYERHNSKKLESRANFSKKVSSRIGRNSVAVRSRSGGVGK